MTIGDRLLRTEDRHLITGQTTWTANRIPSRALHLVFVRSPVAHARIQVDASRAGDAPGVVAVWTARDVTPLCASLPSLYDSPDMALVAGEVVRYVGEAVAVIIAGSERQAVDAAELVDVDYEVLPVVADAEAAVVDGAPVLHDDHAGNIAFEESDQNGEVDAAISEAAVVIKRRFEQPRVFVAAMEPRTVVVEPDSEGYTVTLSTQMPHIVQHLLAQGSGVPESQLRVIAPDVGGGFGAKFFYAEELVALLAARALGRSIAWVATRSEDLQSTFHGRALIQDVTLTATADGVMTGLDVDLLSDVGAYSTPLGAGSALEGTRMYPGVYRIPNYRYRCRGALTNKTPVGAYRGAGRPEATFAIERVVDELAAELAIDPLELRRRNWIGADEFPYRTSGGITYDVGDYAATADGMRDLSGYDQLRARQATVNIDGATTRLGLGVCTYVEVCGGGVRYDKNAVETASVRLTPNGAEVIIGTTAFGTGHATSWAQIVSGVLGVDPADVRVVQGDTSRARHGFDSYGSRSLSVVGSALYEAATEVRARATEIAARLLECSLDDVEFAAGTFSVRGTQASRTIGEVATASYKDRSLGDDGFDPGLGCTRTSNLRITTFPNGAHLAVVEVDVETGFVTLVDYVAVDDVGKVVNPMIVEGQVHGGVVQGIAQALYEEVVYDGDANLISPSFAEYGLPGAPDLVTIRTDRRVTPATSNPLGTKGVGEAGAIAAPAAVMNAVLDALRPLGVTDLAMPATPHRVWQAVQVARSSPPGDR